MATSDLDRASAAPGATLLLPVAILLHQLEEWFGGFPEWIRSALGFEVTAQQFLSVNTVGLLILGAGSLVAYRHPRMAWLAASIASLMGLNAVLHTVASLWTGSWSPGTLTGLLLYLPLVAIVLRTLAARLPRAVFVGAVVGGVLFHALATVTAVL